MIFLKMFVMFAFQEGLSWSYGVCIDVNLCFQLRAAPENCLRRDSIASFLPLSISIFCFLNGCRLKMIGKICEGGELCLSTAMNGSLITVALSATTVQDDPEDL